MGSRYLARKFGQALVTIFAIVLLNFVLFRMMPGSPERVLLRNPYLTAGKVEQVRKAWGLDAPLLPITIAVDPPGVSLNVPNQLTSYIGATFSGDLGYSFKFRGAPVTDVIGQRFWPTILLIGFAEIIAITVGLAIGSYAGWKRGSLSDRVGSGISLVLYSMPYFVIGMPLILIFAAGLGWFPTSGMLTVGATYSSFLDQLFDFGRHLVLPLATVSLGLIGGYSIIMRSSIIETRAEDYVTTARAKGLTDGQVLSRHAFPNAMLPMVTLIAINLGYVVAGAITAEVVFNWPGLGTLTVDALSARDYPVLQGVFLLLSVTVVLANLVADLVYAFLDPRVRS
ncbi:MAG: ABC transporter permease [Candidatus Limnocylindrales bacterium]